MKWVKILYFILSILFLVYLFIPGSRSISDIPNLPNSERSNLSGDTTEIPEIKAFFSNNYRDFVMAFYKNEFYKLSRLPFLPFKLNYPPEYAYTAIKDQTRSTYLEVLYYPFRDSLFINGYEPFDIEGKPRFEGATKFVQDDSYLTKVTLRYYPSSYSSRLLVWILINLSIYLLYKITPKVFRN